MLCRYIECLGIYVKNLANSWVNLNTITFNSFCKKIYIFYLNQFTIHHEHRIKRQLMATFFQRTKQTYFEQSMSNFLFEFVWLYELETHQLDCWLAKLYYHQRWEEKGRP